MDKAQLELIKGYLAKAQEKLIVAQELFRNKHYDDTVSRAYYAAFHAAQAVLLSEGQEADSHKGVVTLFGLFMIKTGKIEKHFGKLLANLKDDRENSDYEVLSFIDAETAKRAVAEAEEFCKAIDQYLRKNKFIV